MKSEVASPSIPRGITLLRKLFYNGPSVAGRGSALGGDRRHRRQTGGLFFIVGTRIILAHLWSRRTLFAGLAALFSSVGFAFVALATWTPSFWLVDNNLLAIGNLENSMGLWVIGLGGVTFYEIQIGELSILLLASFFLSYVLFRHGLSASWMQSLIESLALTSASMAAYELFYAFEMCGNFPGCLAGRAVNPPTGPYWDFWNGQVSNFQFNIGLRWLTNQDVFLACAALATLAGTAIIISRRGQTR